MPEVTPMEVTNSFANMELANKTDEIIRCFGTLDTREIDARMRSDWFSGRATLPEKVMRNFPYLREGPFKTPIPTAKDVEDASPAPRDGRHLPNMVFRVNEIYAVKVSTSNQIFVQAYNIMYLEKLGIRTPKLYAAFSHQGCNPLRIDRAAYTGPLPEYRYMVTEFIDGDLLGLKYKSYSPELQKKVCASVGDQIQKLLDITCPYPEYYGLLDGQSFPGITADFQLQGYPPRGPWYSYDKLVDALIESGRWNCISGSFHTKDYTEIERLTFRHYDYCIRNVDTHARRPVLAHMDPHGHNIIVKHGACDGDFEVVFVDWYSLAWVPAWMCIGNFMHCAESVTKWRDGEYDARKYCTAVLNRLKGPENLALAEWWAKNWGQ